MLQRVEVEHLAMDGLGRNGKVLIVDATNSFIRCFAASTTTNDNGKHIGGVVGFMMSLAMTIRTHNPTRAVLVFDGVGGSLRRRQLFPEYKANRRTMTRLNRFYDFQTIENEKESMTWQMKVLVMMLKLLPLTVIMADHVEADDVIAYLAQHIASNNGQSIIMSTDKDFLQLVNDTNIAVWNPIKRKMYRPKTICEDYGFHPHNFLLYRTMSGDSSDGIPGVRGWKEITILKYFPELALEQPKDIAFLMESAIRINDSLIKRQNNTLKLFIMSQALLERNYELMRLDEVSMSTQTRIMVIEQFNASVGMVDKVQLTKFVLAGNMMNAFRNFDTWLQQSFVPLMRFRNA